MNLNGTNINVKSRKMKHGYPYYESSIECKIDRHYVKIETCYDFNLNGMWLLLRKKNIIYWLINILINIVFISNMRITF